MAEQPIEREYANGYLTATMHNPGGAISPYWLVCCSDGMEDGTFADRPAPFASYTQDAETAFSAAKLAFWED